jgi:hypothetical protein
MAGIIGNCFQYGGRVRFTPQILEEIEIEEGQDRCHHISFKCIAKEYTEMANWEKRKN